MNYEIMDELTSYNTLDEAEFKADTKMDDETRNILVYLGYWQDNKHNPWKYTYDQKHSTPDGLIRTYAEKDPMEKVIAIADELSNTYVFDENKTVKWNREEVSKHNEDRQRRQELLNRLQGMIFETEKKYIIHYDNYKYAFADYFSQTEEFYEILWEQAYEEAQDEGRGMLTVWENYYDLVELIGKLEKTKKRH